MLLHRGSETQAFCADGGCIFPEDALRLLASLSKLMPLEGRCAHTGLFSLAAALVRASRLSQASALFPRDVAAGGREFGAPVGGNGFERQPVVFEPALDPLTVGTLWPPWRSTSS